LLPVNEGRRLLYAGGYPGRAGEVGLIDLDPTTFGAAPKVLARAADTVLALAITRDGRQVAAGGADKLIRVIDVASGKEVRQLSQHADWVMGLAFNADGTRLASASRDGTARVFDAATGEMICAFREHNGPVFDVVFVGDGSQAASAGREGRVRFWTTDKAEQKSNVGELGGEVFKLLNPGELLLAAVVDGSVREVSVKDRKVVRHWMAETGDPVLNLSAGAGPGAWVAGLTGGQVAISPGAGTEAVGKLEVWPRGRD
jgi:WD40 repeat protein